MRKAITIYVDDNSTLRNLCGAFVLVDGDEMPSVSMNNWDLTGAIGLYIPRIGDPQIMRKEEDDDPVEAPETDTES